MARSPVQDEDREAVGLSGIIGEKGWPLVVVPYSLFMELTCSCLGVEWGGVGRVGSAIKEQLMG